MKDPRFDPLPSDASKRLRRFVRDLAWGFLNNQWKNAFYIEGMPDWGGRHFASEHNPDLEPYLAEVWNNQPPDLDQLVDMGYIEDLEHGIGDDIGLYKLTVKGLELVDQVDQRVQPSSIFISYCRSESTPFAILLSDRLKANGHAPFLDNQPDKEDQGISLRPGGEWRSDLKAAIEARDYFVILIAPTTLSSEFVCQELEWALASHKEIIPIWHRSFDPRNDKHLPDTIPPSIRKAITEINAIPVIAEDPIQYEGAIQRFLSLFGITPNGEVMV